MIAPRLIDDRAMLTRFALAFHLLLDSRIRRVLMVSLLGSLGLLALLVATLGGVLSLLPVTGWGWLDGVLASFVRALVIFFVVLVSFPALIGVFVSLFVDGVAACAEAEYGADLPPPRPLSAGKALMLALKYAGLIVLVNILLLPGVLLGPLYPLVYYGANSYLLGREYFDLVALRRLSPDQVVVWRRRARSQIWLHGMGVFFLFSLPLVNLLAPLIATITLALLLVDLIRHAPSMTGHQPPSSRGLISGPGSKQPGRRLKY